MPSAIPHTGPYDSDFDDPAFDVDLETYPPEANERTSAVIAHVSGLFTILGPLLVYFLKRDESAYVEDQAAEALNFHITVTLAAVVFGVLSAALIGIPFLLATLVLAVALPIRAGLAANRGRRYRYPLTVRFIR